MLNMKLITIADNCEITYPIELVKKCTTLANLMINCTDDLLVEVMGSFDSYQTILEYHQYITANPELVEKNVNKDNIIETFRNRKFTHTENKLFFVDRGYETQHERFFNLFKVQKYLGYDEMHVMCCKQLRDIVEKYYPDEESRRRLFNLPFENSGYESRDQMKKVSKQYKYLDTKVLEKVHDKYLNKKCECERHQDGGDSTEIPSSDYDSE